jgi:hypothetical protein
VSTGRVSLVPRHKVTALSPDEQDAVAVVETHLWKRLHQQRRDPFPALEVLPDGDGVGVFLTISHVQDLLREIGARKKGEDFAAEILKTILPRLGLLEDTGRTRKPRAKSSRGSAAGKSPQTGGRHAQPSLHRSYWLRIFKLPTLIKLLTPIAGAYPSRPGTSPARPRGEASLVGLLRCQGLISGSRRRGGFSSVSVQAAFWATGPP